MQQREFMTSDQVYEDLCLKIEKLKYMPGEKISENDLCQAYNVSRHIVRSAITRLKDRKLITVYPQRGTFVSLIDMEFVEMILYLRESVEQEAIRRLKFVPVERRLEMIKQMRENVVKQQAAVKNTVDMDAFYEIDNEFHACFLRAVGKGHVMDIVRDQFIHVRRWRNFEIDNTKRQMGLVEEHIAITDALEMVEYKKAHEQLHLHLNTVQRLQPIFRQNSPEYFIFKNSWEY